MSYTPMPVERFGGLNLAQDPSDLAWTGAASVQNVDFDLNGTVRARPGYAQTDANTITTPSWLARFRGSSQYVLLGATLRAYNSSFVSTATAASGGVEAVEFGSTTAGYLYIAVAFGSVLGRWDGAAYTTVAGSARGRFIAVQPNDNRLVVGGATPSAGEASTVSFSNAGDPTTWGVNDWVALHPNDGQEIKKLVSWGNLLFAFKQTKFFVFYGNSVDSTGNPIFNYRTVDAGAGCGYDYAACAAHDGVYFIHTDGVYRTTGGPPELVSGPIQPFFDKRTNGIFTPTGPLTTPRIHAGDDRLYVWQKGATGMFVMDLRSREWTYWVLGVAPYTLLPLDTPREFIFTNSTGQLYKFSPDYTDDAATAIASNYQPGFQQLDKSGLPVNIRRFELTGTGTVTLTLYSDHVTSSEWSKGKTAQSVTMGTSPAVARSYAYMSGQARDLAFKVSATSGAWSLNRWSALVDSVRSY